MMTPENARALTSDEFGGLADEDKADVLRCLFNAGALERPLENDISGRQRQLECYRQVIALGGQAQVFNDLIAQGKAYVLRSLVNAAAAESRPEDNRAAWKKMLERYREAVDLGGQEKVFANLNAEGKEAVLKALFGSGNIYARLEENLADNSAGWEEALKRYCQAVDLGGQEEVFNGLNSEGKATVLKALFNAGHSEGQLVRDCEGLRKKLGWLLKAVALGAQKQRFKLLNNECKSRVLQSLVLASVVKGQLENNPKEEIDGYRQVEDLGGQKNIFAKLHAEGKAAVLTALVKAGNFESNKEDNRERLEKALEWHRKAVALSGQPQVFSDLDEEGKEAALTALANTAFFAYQLNKNRRGSQIQLGTYNLAMALAGRKQVFDRLNARGKGLVLQMLVKAADVERRLQDDNSTSWQIQLDWYCKAAALGRQEKVFASVDAKGRSATVMAVLNTGVLEGRLSGSPEGWQQALKRYHRQALALGETHWNETGTVLQGWPGSMFEMASALRLARFQNRGWVSVWGVLCEYKWELDTVSTFNNLLGFRPPREAIDGADLWLQSSHIWGAKPSFSEHSRTVVDTARVRLAQLRLTQRQNVLTSWCLHEKWPINFEGLGHWVLAHLAVFAPDLLPPSADGAGAEQNRWEPDVQAIANVLRWEELWTDEITYKAPYYLTDLLPSERIHFVRYDCTAEHQEEMRSWFSALHAGNPKLMAEALHAAWLGLMDYQLTGVGRLCEWLMSQGINETCAWQRARDAILTARCDDLLQEVLEQRWDQPSEIRAAYRSLENARLAEAAAATRRHVPLQASMQHNLRFFANATLNQMLCVNDAKGKPDENQLWELLQLERLGVALAIKPKRPPGWSANMGLTWDSQAEGNIQAMQTKLLLRAQLHDEARQRGDHLPKANERNEPLEPFATYAQEWKRMGWDLVLPTPQQTADCLREGQALVQLHLSQEGSALHALVLQPSTASQPALSLHALGAEDIDVQTVTLAAKQWQQALAEWDAVSTSELSPDLYALAVAEPMQALQIQWQWWQASSHPLQKVMRWLHEKAPEGAVCVWPPAWSSLPWQALWAQTFALAEPLRCVASVGAWVQAQTRAAQENGTNSQPLEPVVLSSLDVWADGGESEVRAIAGMFDVEPQASNDLGAVMKALKTRGPVHLAMHGQFDAIDPWRSALVVEQLEEERQTTRGARLHVRKLRKVPSQQDQKDPTQHRSLPGPTTVDEQDSSAVFEQARLPAWALTHLEIQADITLGVCESLQEGQGEGQAAQLGAAGFGAMLMAAGARSVAGSLWACDAWSAAMFFDFWYEERRKHPAALALQKAQRSLRELDEKSFLDRVGKAAPQVTERAKGRCELARNLGWTKPFDHPSCWAAFALLGDAPALPELKAPAPSKRSVVEIFTGWLASWWHR